MLYVLNPDTKDIDTYPGAAMLRPTTTCRAPCCDVDCASCSPEQMCAHSRHEPEIKFCVNVLQEETAEYGEGLHARELLSGEFACGGTYTQSATFMACSCQTEADCTHTDERGQLQAMQRTTAPGRAAGALNQRLFAQAKARTGA